VISRVADHCFWFGRYLERAESTARVLGVTDGLALDGYLTPRQCWQPVLIVTGVEADFVAKYGADAVEDGEKVQEHVTWGEENLSSIRTSINAARSNARSMRELLSLEVWITINELYLWIRGEAARQEYVQRRYDFYRHVREQIQLCLGLLRSTMLQDAPLDFIWLGVLLERANQTARILDTQHHAMNMLASTHQVLETNMWLSLLRACSGSEPFMKRSRGRVTGQAVAAFLVLEPKFPRSVRYCVRSAFERLCAIRPPSKHHLPGGRALERLRVLDTWLTEQSPQHLAVPGAVHEVLTQVVDETQEVCNELARELFGHGDRTEPQSPRPAVQ
jgi:uncharacterized alpha-E superfamily protein